MVGLGGADNINVTIEKSAMRLYVMPRDRYLRDVTSFPISVFLRKRYREVAFLKKVWPFSGTGGQMLL